jgi:sialidase-1
MDRDLQPSLVHEAYIEDHRTDGLRSGEGCVAALPDGSLYMVYGRFEGTSDHAKATLVERRSTDGGLHWSKAVVLRETPAGALNLMSVSLLPLDDGRLACVYLRKNALSDCRPCFMTSGDGARTWSEPRYALDKPGYYVVNNDRLVQLNSGRLLIPYTAYGPEPRFNLAEGVYCGCALSDDRGATWRRGTGEIRIEPANVRLPLLADEARTDSASPVNNDQIQCQEPGVVELADGRIMMWCRSRGGYAYRVYSADGGETWSPFEAIADFAMPNGPQSIKRLPGSARLVMLYNDRRGVPFGHPQFQWRRPLAMAVSDDGGLSWRRLGLLEPETVPTTCYYSICFHADNVVFTYYEGVMMVRDNLYVPRNLASLKLKIVKRSYFEL